MGTNNKNNFYGDVNVNGPTQIVAGNLINNKENDYEKNASYKPEPIWRSPFTMGVLTWISAVIGLFEIFPISKMVKYAIELLKMQDTSHVGAIIIYSIVFAVVLFILIIITYLRNITKKQIRYPLLFNFAISGYDKRLTIEKIHIDSCPKCGGKIKYYNKPIEWLDTIDSNGRVKRKITKTVPALECKRNSEHWYKVDPAENHLDY